MKDKEENFSIKFTHHAVKEREKKIIGHLQKVITEVKIETEVSDKIAKYMHKEGGEGKDLIQAKFISLKDTGVRKFDQVQNFTPNQIDFDSAISHLNGLKFAERFDPNLDYEQELKLRKDCLKSFKESFVKTPEKKKVQKLVDQQEILKKAGFKDLPDIFKIGEMSSSKKARYKKRMKEKLIKPQPIQEILKSTSAALEPLKSNNSRSEQVSSKTYEPDVNIFQTRIPSPFKSKIFTPLKLADDPVIEDDEDQSESQSPNSKSNKSRSPKSRSPKSKSPKSRSPSHKTNLTNRTNRGMSARSQTKDKSISMVSEKNQTLKIDPQTNGLLVSTHKEEDEPTDRSSKMKAYLQKIIKDNEQGRHFRQETETATSTRNLAKPKHFSELNLTRNELYLLQYLSPKLTKVDRLKIDVFNTYKEISKECNTMVKGSSELKGIMNKKFSGFQGDVEEKISKFEGNNMEIENEIKKDIFREIQNSSKNVFILGNIGNNKPKEQQEVKKKSRSTSSYTNPNRVAVLY